MALFGFSHLLPENVQNIIIYIICAIVLGLFMVDPMLKMLKWIQARFSKRSPDSSGSDQKSDV